ncbi:MAG: hypothetical protein WC365_07805, partial [Candidatus Babeliales bacterium]
MKFYQLVVFFAVCLMSTTLNSAQAPLKETTCEAFARIFSSTQTAQKSTNELAVIIEKFFPLPSLLASAYSTAPLELVDLIVSYLYDEPRSAQGNTPLMIFLEIAEHYGY